MPHQYDGRFDFRAFEHPGQLFGGGERRRTPWGRTGPTETRPVITYDCGEFRDTILDQRPTDGTRRNPGLQHDRGASAAPHIDMQLTSADIDHASRRCEVRHMPIFTG